MSILSNNPYRILGVYSNASTKERVANHNRMKAFLKVGKSVTFPLDLLDHLPPLKRTEEMVINAESKLTLPKDQILYAQLWFVKVTPLDEVAFNHFFAGDIDKAEEIWQKKVCGPSLQNLIVSSLIQGNHGQAVLYAESLYTDEEYISELVTAVIGIDQKPNTTELTHSLLDVLGEEIGVDQLLKIISIPTWKEYIGNKAVKPLINKIEDAIEVAKKSKGKSPKERWEAGTKLVKETKSDLSQLKTLLPSNDLQYQVIADKLGIEILQCGIDYFNGSSRSTAATNAMKLQKYALQIVVGQMARDRCKENVDILQEIIDDLPPEEIAKESDAIHKLLRGLNRETDGIDAVISMLNNSKAHLQAIKEKVGASNGQYLKISTIVVNAALGKLIEAVNEAQKEIIDHIDNPYVSDQKISNLRNVLEKSWEATTIMDRFDMEADFKLNKYKKNRAILKELCDQLGVDTSSPSRPTRRQSSPQRETPPTTTTTTPTTTYRTPTTSPTTDEEKSSCFIAASRIAFLLIVFYWLVQLVTTCN